jgi:hypothetical protein
MILQLGVLALTLLLFAAWGLPIAAALRGTMPAMTLSTPAFGAASLAVIVTLVYIAGLDARVIGLLAILLSILSAAAFRRTVRYALVAIARERAATLVLLAASLVIISPIASGRPEFTVFQGNEGDQFGYTTTAVVFSRLSFHDVVNATTTDSLANPLLPIASANCFARPTVDILFAAIGSLIPGSITVGGYAFLCSFSICGLLSFAGALLQLCERAGGRNAVPALLLAGAYACGFWGQYPVDIDAWSEVAATPLLLSAWTLVIALLAAPAPNGVAVPALALGIVIGGALYLYPEGSLYHALILPAVVIAAGGPRWRGLAAVTGAACFGVALSLLFWRGTLGFLLAESPGSMTARAGWYAYYDAYLFGLDPAVNRSLQDSLNAALAQMPPYFTLVPHRAISLVTGLGGVLGVYFLTPENYGVLTGRDAAKAILLLLVVLGIIVGPAGGLRSRARSYRLLATAAAIGLVGALLLLEIGQAWSAGKALAYAAPLLCLAIAAPGMSPGWSRFGPVPWSVAQLCFAVTTLAGLQDPDGVRLPAPYPEISNPLLKGDDRWDIARRLARLRKCQIVQIVAPEPTFRLYAAIALYESRIRYFYTEPVNTYFDRGRDLGTMETAEVAPSCRLLQPGASTEPIPPGPPAAVARFPRGLMVPNLAFSGVSPDGWLTDRARVVLALAGGSDVLHLAGDVPDFSRKITEGTMKITVDGILVVERPETSGRFDLRVPIPKGQGPRAIALEMTGADRLPAPDGRLVSVHLTAISLETGEGSAAEDEAPE